MYICAFKFDINWFTTLPGMLISGGVVLLLLALLLFATSGKKNKVKKEDVVATNVAPNFTDPAMNANVGMDPMMNQNYSNDPTLGVDTQAVVETPVVPNNTMDPSVDGMQSVNPTPIDPVRISTENINPIEINPVNNDMTNINMETVQPVNIDPMQVNVNPMNQEVNPVNIMEENTEVTFINTDNATIPSGSPVDMATPSVDSVASNMTDNTGTPELSAVTPVVEDNNMQMSDLATSTQPVNNVQVQPEETDVVIPIVEPTTTAYGGVSPTVDIPKEESSHQIYGGANPLDKTQTIPIINNQVEQNIVEEKQETMEKTAEIPSINTNGTPVYQEAKLVEDKDIEVLDF